MSFEPDTEEKKKQNVQVFVQGLLPNLLFLIAIIALFPAEARSTALTHERLPKTPEDSQHQTRHCPFITNITCLLFMFTYQYLLPLLNRSSLLFELYSDSVTANDRDEEEERKL